MAFETLTEQIIWKHFEKNSEEILIESKQTKNSIINNLLLSASKSGDGKGYPDFLIQFNNNPNLLIVIECKGDIHKHSSKDKNKPKDFAVDGVLHYSKFLSKKFDVIAIAISGNDINKFVVSNFLQLKNNDIAVDFLNDRLYTIDEYYHGIQNSKYKFNQDFHKLYKYSKGLSEKLHSLNFPEERRCLLISGVLIACSNLAFKNSYMHEKNSESCARYLIDKIKEELVNSGIQGQKLDIMMSEFQQLKTAEFIFNQENPRILVELIDEIDENINKFQKNHDYFDHLGQLYIEFLRFSNSDKSLGIVLTPPHITEFFVDVAGINGDSIVYDNCTGTAGFLIAAMKKMVQAVGQEEIEKIHSIKTNQLFGIEFASKIYPLAISNMIIHNDGKTNILFGDCFDKDKIEFIKQKKPNIGLLNPPYKSKKQSIEELDFVLNNLECLTVGGTCITIVPMSCAIEVKKKILFLKNKILKLHTLEAVFTMPVELFFNSKVSVPTCVMVFTAHKPHPSNKQTFFGYFKDDGFIKRKDLGRHDGLNKFEKIKNLWLNAFVNRKEIKGISVNQSITADSEWCAESYMETDYSVLNRDEFATIVLDYATFLLKNRYLNDQSFNGNFNNSLLPINSIEEINVNNWQKFSLNDIFPQIVKSKCSNVNGTLIDGEEINYIGAKKTENGVMNRVLYDEKYVSKGNCIVLIGQGQGSAGYSLYQPVDFIGSSSLFCCYNRNINQFNALFLVRVLDCERFRYSFGRGISKKIIDKTSIYLPAKDNQPDWDYMEQYIKTLPYSALLVN